MTILVSGLGVVTPAGNDPSLMYGRLLSGQSCFRRISTFDPSPYRSQIAGEVDWNPTEHGITGDDQQLDRVVQFALYAARQAWSDANLEHVPPTRRAVVVGTAVGLTISLENQYRAASRDGDLQVLDPALASPQATAALSPASMLQRVADEFDAGGPCFVVSTGCTSGIDAVAQGASLIRTGRADVVVVVAADAPISPITVACFDAIKATSPDNDEPLTACRPFDSTRRGFVLAEGSTALVLAADTVAAQSHAPYARISGWAARSNAYHMTGLRPDGTEMADAIQVALDRAGVPPTAIDYISAHGSGTVQNDIHETAAVRRALKSHAETTPMSSIKSVIGHSLGAIGATEIAVCALAIREGMIPPTANLQTVDPKCGLDYVPLVGRPHTTQTALSVASGFGGFQSAMIVAAV